VNAETDQRTPNNRIALQPACGRCHDPLQPHIMYGDMRYYVCRGCGTWAVPYPPARSTAKTSALAGSLP
jgi:hypothetical protein